MGPTERTVEMPWVNRNLFVACRTLDVGCVDSTHLAEMSKFVRKGAYGIDTREPTAPLPEGFHFVKGDCREMPREWSGWFDLVTCVSVLDHVGLAAYGNQADGRSLFDAAAELARVTAVAGCLLLTVPFGRDLVTTHPGGGQRVFSMATLYDLFPPLLWDYVRVDCWRLWPDRNEYLFIDYVSDFARNAGYAEYRAEACIALKLVRK